MKPLVYKLGRFLLWSAASAWPADIQTGKEIRGFSTLFKNISSDYLMVLDSTADVLCDPSSLQRFLTIARETRAGVIYSDFFDHKNGNYQAHPLMDYQPGAIRDDFNFGHFFIVSTAAIKTALQRYGNLPHDPDIGLYDLRLKISIDHLLLHIPESLYAVSSTNLNMVKTSDYPTETHFAYVAKENLTRQNHYEKIVTNYLKQIGAHLPARTQKVPEEPVASDWTASIIIPVFNRKKTITDALTSALSQKANFAFNILVVDNNSTDGTTNILKKFAAEYPQIHHIIPSRRDLGIGGCWNEAIVSPFCGQYIIQLDSDDLYSSPRALQKIVNTMRQGRYAMVVGSYTLVNEKLKTIPPGLIDHTEWTQQNGHNNLLRVNGMGAPRAFNTAIIRQTGFPNVSYGEDYAVALRISRDYKIGRIFDSLYLCRRWADNTDAGLSVEKQNRNDYYKDKLRTMEIKARQLLNCRERIETTHGDDPAVPYGKFSQNQNFAEFAGKENILLPSLCQNLFNSQKKSWPQLANACRDLASIRERELSCGKYKVTLQYNPARAVSSGAAVDAESIKKRPCFLCRENLPKLQQGILYRGRYLILCNPAPIFDRHFTMVTLEHQPQKIASSLGCLLQLAVDASPEYTVFYNGPACGASAPDHLHFQMIPSDALPYLNELKDLAPVKETGFVGCSAGKDSDRSVIVLTSKNEKALNGQFMKLVKAAQKTLLTDQEPLVNVLCNYEGDCWRLFIFLRKKHRPDAYFAEGEKRIFISPGAIDMAGVIITPLAGDYEHLDGKTVRDIYREVSRDEKTVNKIIKDIHHE